MLLAVNLDQMERGREKSKIKQSRNFRANKSRIIYWKKKTRNLRYNLLLSNRFPWKILICNRENSPFFHKKKLGLPNNKAILTQMRPSKKTKK